LFTYWVVFFGRSRPTFAKSSKGYSVATTSHVSISKRDEGRRRAEGGQKEIEGGRRGQGRGHTITKGPLRVIIQNRKTNSNSRKGILAPYRKGIAFSGNLSDNNR
jgi:hypothetical protein